MYDDPYGTMATMPNAMTTSTNHVDGGSTSMVLADSFSTSAFAADGTSYGDADSESSGQAHTNSHIDADTISDSEGDTESSGISESWSHAVSENFTSGRSRTATRGVTPSVSEEEGWSESETISPFHEYHREEITNSRTYLTPEAQTLLAIQTMKAIPKAHFLIKAPEAPACIVQAPWVDEPKITAQALTAGLQRVYALPYYTSIEVLDGEAHEITVPIHRALPAPPESDEDDDMDCWRTERPAL